MKMQVAHNQILNTHGVDYYKMFVTMALMGDSMNNQEMEHADVESPNIFARLLSKRMTRRTLEKAVVGAAAIGVVGAGVEAKFDPLSIVPDQERKISPDSVFDNIFAKIDGIRDSEERQEALEKAKELQKIMDVNGRLMDSYSSDLDESGKPRYESMIKKGLAGIGDQDIASHIFIAGNNILAEKLVLGPLTEFVNSRGGNVATAVKEVRSAIDNDSVEERKFFGADVRLKDYITVDTKKDGILVVGPGSDEELTDEQRVMLDKDVANVRAIYESAGFPVMDTRVNIWSKDKYGPDNKYPDKGAGNFKQSDTSTEVNIDLGENLDNISKFVLLHENDGHGMDPALNKKLLQYFKPEEFYKLLVGREKCLADESWGRSYPSIKKVFDKREKSVAPLPVGGDVIGPPDPPSLQSSKSAIEPPHLNDLVAGLADISEMKGSNDDYPDGIFCTGYYLDSSLTQNNLFDRKVDEDVIREYTNMFDNSEKVSASLKDFLDNEDNKSLLDVVAEKSPWLGAVIKTLDKLTPIVDGKMDWMNVYKRSEKSGEVSKTILELPRYGSTDKEWFQFCTGLGKRLAFIQMLHDNDPALNLLSEEERADFKGQLQAAFRSSDNEMFANMMAISIINESKVIFITPNPYLEYRSLMQESFQAKGIKVVPSEELYAAVQRTGNSMGNA